jgi:hypothetical protein
MSTPGINKTGNKVKVEWSDSTAKGDIPLNCNGRPCRMLKPGKEYIVDEAEYNCLTAKSLVFKEETIMGSSPEGLGPQMFKMSERGRINVILLDSADSRVITKNKNLESEIESLKKQLAAKTAGKKVGKDEVPDERGDNSESTV